MNSFLKGRLKYVTGDATIPESGGHRLIAHICNIDGGWGAGFVVAISKRWKKPEEEYRKWFNSKLNFKFGEIQEVSVQSDTSVINMLAMSYKENDPVNKIPLRYDALENCLSQVVKLAKRNGSSLHMPRIGAGLGSGYSNGYNVEVWDRIEKIIIEKLIDAGINVTIYDLPKK